MAALFQKLKVWIDNILAKLLNHRRSAHVAGSIETHRRTEEMVRLLQAEDWTGLRRRFAIPLRWLVPSLALRKGFDLVSLSAGPLEYVESPVISTGWLPRAQVPLRFQRAKLALSLTMTPYGSLIGFRIVPLSLAGLGKEWLPPMYASVEGIEEQEVELGPSGLKVKGMLTLPRGTAKAPCVVMLPGSGPMDRDSSVGPCKPFKDLALGLAGHGIATMRFDKVTLTHGGKVQHKQTFTLTDEYLEHALDAVRQCLAQERIMDDGVSVLGHSLGGYVAPKLALMEHRIAGCILMATPSIPVHRSALGQYQHFAAMDESPSDASKDQIKELERQCELADSEDLDLSTPATRLPLGVGPAYWLDTRNFTPLHTAANLKTPLLVMQGGRDYQVTASEDHADWQHALKDKVDATMRVYDKLNHLFIEGDGQSTPLEYEIPGNVAEAVIKDIAGWVLDALKAKA